MQEDRTMAAAIIFGVGSQILLAFALGWVFMLTVGVIHHEWIPQLPTLGYWWAFLIIALIRSCLTGLKGAE